MTTITSQFTFANGQPFAGRTITINPLTYPRIGNNKDIIVGEARTLTTNLDGTFTASIEPGTYSLQCNGPSMKTIFSILVPDTASVVNIADIITDET